MSMSSTTDKKEGMLTMKHLNTTIAATLAVAILAAMTMQPAKADGAASTRNIILGAAALAAGIAIESNAAHKHQVANTIQGYLPDGSVVYADGHVVLPNGQIYYPRNYGQTVACSNQVCYISGGNGNGPYYGNAGYNGNSGYYGNNGYQGNNGYNGTTPYYGNNGGTPYRGDSDGRYALARSRGR